MSHLILVRHGQSEWNLQNRFTGWVDVDLTANGKLEACKAGELIKDLNIEITYFYSSYQKRAINTLGLILNTINIRLDAKTIAYILNHSDAKVLVVDRQLHKEVKKALNSIKNKITIIDLSLIHI